MVRRIVNILIILAILFPAFIFAQGEIGSISIRSQGEIGFQFESMDVPEIGNLQSPNDGFYQIQFDQSVYLQLSRIFSVGIGAGIGTYNTREFDFFRGFFDQSNASATHVRLSLYSRFVNQFSDKIGMYHEIQFRYQLGKFERLSPNGTLFLGDVNLVGLGYNPIIYYKVTENLHLEGAIHGISLFRTRANPDFSDDFFVDLNTRGRVRMGLLMGISYYFSVDEEVDKNRKRRKKRRRR